MKPSFNIFDLIFGLFLVTALILLYTFDRIHLIERNMMTAFIFVFLAGKYSDYIGEKILKWAKRK